MKYIKMCYYIKPPGGAIPTNTQSLDPRFPLVYGIQDDLEVASITFSLASGRFFEWDINFLKKNGLPLDTGDVQTIKVQADISDQDSFPRTNVDFSTVEISEIERINTDLINFGQTDLTLLVKHLGELEEDPIDDILWNCTCFTSAQIILSDD